MADVRKKEKKVKTIEIHLLSVSSEQAFLELLAREVIKVSYSVALSLL
jgi:hypothetical protein